MDNEAPNVLLIQNDSIDVDLIGDVLKDIYQGASHFDRIENIRDGVEHLATRPADVILLDVSVGPGTELEIFDRVAAAAPNTPILVLGVDDRDLEAKLLQHGAQDYLARNRIDSDRLTCALRYLKFEKKTKDALLKSEARFRAISDASPLGIFVSDMQGNCTYSNAAYQRISGLSSDGALGELWTKAVHPEDRARIDAAWQDAVREGKPFEVEHRFSRGDRGVVWTRVNSAPLKVAEKLLGYVLTVEDITERKVLDDALFEEKERAQVTLNSIADAVLTTDIHGNVTYLNTVAEKLTGWSARDALAKPISAVLNIVDSSTRRPTANPLAVAIGEKRAVELTANSVLIRRDGSESGIEDSAAPIHDREGNVTGGVMVFHDASESRSAALKMTYMAEHDSLTDLPNRVLLNDRLGNAIALALRHHKKVAVLFLDLDRFKAINDLLGHSVGDKLLCSVAARLGACVRNSDTVCRQGGDEFLVLLSEVGCIEDAANFAEKIGAALAVPHAIGNHELRTTASIGISLCPDHGNDVETVIDHADTAMYDAKARGRNQYRIFTHDMSVCATQRLVLESELHRAVNRREFILNYQPKMNLDTGELVGAEALARWLHPHLGLLPPAHFIHAAEQCNLIIPIGKWVLREACRQAKVWLDAGLRPMPVAVNISATQFRDINFLDDVTAILRDTGLKPECLELELTESVLMHDAENATAVLKAIKRMGVKLAIDDFGTGYSSLSYLKQFPIDTLKIDQSFVHGISNDPDDATIVSAIISMGRSLNQRVIAEGIETSEQLAFLRAHQCHEGQGFLFSHALSASDFANFANARRVRFTTPAHQVSATMTGQPLATAR